jgi:dihydroorotate dehydrogenase
MSAFYEKIIRPLIFKMEPERAHDLTLTVLRWAGTLPAMAGLIRRWFAAHSHDDLSVDAFGLKFSNPVGLAAGYDKDGLAWRGLMALGFGHIEVGTVTPHPQTGNPKPRIFRIPEENAMINRMGFPGEGADIVVRRLASRETSRSPLVIGVNIGRNKDTPNEEASQDYLDLFEKFFNVSDYMTVNVSSPNTVGLRRLQARDQLEDLLGQLRFVRSKMDVYKPIMVKLSPDLNDEELEDALGAILATEMDGVVATNTTVSRDGLNSSIGTEAGGLSGVPLKMRSRRLVSEIYQRTGGKLPIIGVGGIMNSEDARLILDAGASLIQVYTGLVYRGPGLVKEILESLSKYNLG